MTSPVRPYRSRLLLPETLPFPDAKERRWFYNYRGAGGPWTPVQLSGLAFWGSGDSATVDGSGNLTAWPSRSGSLSGAPGTAAPTVVTVNGKKWVRFTAASSQYVTLDALADLLTGSDKPYTLAVSLKLAATATTMAYFSLGKAADGVPFDWRGATSGSVWIHQRRDDAGVTTNDVRGTATVDTSAHVLVDTFSGTATSHYVDGAADFEDQACDVGTMTVNRATIGCRRTNVTASFLGGDIRQIVIVPGRVITADERALLTAYLAADAGVTLA